MPHRSQVMLLVAPPRTHALAPAGEDIHRIHYEELAYFDQLVCPPDTTGRGTPSFTE